MYFPTSLSQRLIHQHEMLHDLLADITPEHFNKQPQPGKWSIQQQLAHITVYQPVFKERMEKILNENEPTFGRYLADSDPEFLATAEFTSDILKKQLFAQRKEIINLFAGLTPEQIKRKGGHPLFGAMTLEQWVQFFVLHESHHLFSIFRLKNAKS